METSAGKEHQSDSSEGEEKISEQQQQLWNKIEKLLEEYYLSAFQKLACKKFIQDKVANPDDKTVSRVRDWLFMRLNGKLMPEVYHPR